MRMTLVKEEKIEEDIFEIPMEKPLQRSEPEKATAAIEEEMGPMMNCKDCTFSSENEDISKLHLLSHRYSEAEIIEKFPPMLKNLKFSSEEEFRKKLDLFLESLSANGKNEDLK